MNNQKSAILASSNRIVWEYFQCLRDQVRLVEEATVKETIPRMVLPCVFMAIAIIETFLNVYFRQLAQESGSKHIQEQILKELDENVTLDLKIKVWPKRFFEKGLDFGCGIGQRFMKLKNLRNKLMHFKSSYETFEMPGLKILGLADMTIYEGLNKNTALESLNVAEGIPEEVFRLKGFSTDEIAHSLHLWTGKVPNGV